MVRLFFSAPASRVQCTDCNSSKVICDATTVLLVYVPPCTLHVDRAQIVQQSVDPVMPSSATCAGLQNLILTYIPSILFSFLVPIIPLSWAADHFIELISGFTILAASLSIALYITSFVGSRELAASGTSGYLTYDFWMGRELNPRIERLDWKEFCELYPGLIGWATLNLAFAHKQFEQTSHVRSQRLCMSDRSHRCVQPNTAACEPVTWEAEVKFCMDAVRSGLTLFWCSAGEHRDGVD